MNESKDKENSQERLLGKVTPDRRNFVRSLLGLSVYAAPVVTSFIMATAGVEPAAAQKPLYSA